MLLQDGYVTWHKCQLRLSSQEGCVKCPKKCVYSWGAKTSCRYYCGLGITDNNGGNKRLCHVTDDYYYY